jgi:Flp pilus assembly protein TadB
MQRRRDLIVANGAGLLVVVVALLLGWREAAAFGLAVLLILDVMVLVRGRPGRRRRDREDDSGQA